MLTRNLRIRFVEGEGGESGGSEPVDTSTSTSTETQDQQQAQPTGQDQQQSQGNPAWAPIREALDPISFARIEAHLKEMDRQAQARITSVNQQFEPYKAHLADRQPDFVQKALAYADQLDADPVAVYQMLGEFLKQTGQLPSADQLEEALEGADQQGQQPQADPRVDQLQAQLQQLEAAENQRRADAWLDSEKSKLMAAHPELIAEDVTEIIRRAAFVAQQNQGRPGAKVPTLEEAYQEFTALRNRILSQPRPADSAPQLVPTSGGTPPAPGQQKSLGKLSRAETQDAVAALLEQHKG